MPGETEVKDSGAVRAPHFELGARGEALAIEHLERVGYRIVAANFSLPIGRNTRDAIVNAEIDLVAYDGATLCFVEVKTRESHEFGEAAEAVTPLKQRTMVQLAIDYMARHRLTSEPCRFDVVSIHLEAGRPVVELFQNAFNIA